MTLLPETFLKALLIGRARPFGPEGEASAIDKQALDHPVQLTLTRRYTIMPPSITPSGARSYRKHPLIAGRRGALGKTSAPWA